MEDKSDLTRRNVLTAASGAIAAAGLTGLAGAASGKVEINVGFSNPSGAKAAEQAADSVKRRFNFDAMTIEVPSNAIKGLQNNPNVRYVEKNGEYHALGQTLPWGIDRVDADVAHSNGETGNGGEIAILDTGIDSDHPDLAGNVKGGKCFTADCCGEVNGGCRYGRKPNDNTCHHPWDDDGNHGTHCSGSADALDDSSHVVGVSTEADLYAGKVLDGCGSGSWDSVAAGIQWAADQGFDVASMSLGGSSGSSVVKDAVQYAYGKGVLLVASAGNSGPCSDCVGYPAAYQEVIAVSATSSDDTLASFSSTGPEVEITAPGEDILSTVPPETSSDGLDTYSGTSMSCPHVSGAGAQLMSNGYSNTEARQQLKDTAEDIGLASNEQGAGLLDVEAALGGGGGGNSAPAVDSLSASEVETDNTDAEFDVSWQVSDADGDLSSVDLTLTDDTDSQTEDTASISVSGDTASGTTRLVAAGDDGSGNSYTVELVVTDSNGASSSDTAAVSETEDGGSGGDNAPAIDQFSLTNDSNPAWTRYYVDWAVSDSDGDLADVTSEMVDSSGSVVASESSSVSGSSASGTHYLRAKGSASEIVLTVTDGAGNSTSSSKSI